jgi:hypothetical protein
MPYPEAQVLAIFGRDHDRRIAERARIAHQRGVLGFCPPGKAVPLRSTMQLPSIIRSADL